MPRGRKKIEKTQEKEKLQKHRGRKKKNKEPRVKISELEVGYYTYDELREKGYVSPNGKAYDMELFKWPYFKSLPGHLVVTKDTEIGAKLWSAIDIFNQRSKEVYFLHKHRDVDRGVGIWSPLLEATDTDNIRRIFGYEQVCRVPSTHRAAQTQSLESVIENIEKVKVEAKKNRQRKAREKAK